MEKDKEKIKSRELLHNLKLTWKLTKGSRKYLLGVLVFTTLLCLTSAILPTFSAKQILYIKDSIWDKLIWISIYILIFELSVNVFRFFDRKFSQLFYRETLISIQMNLAKETLKLETEVIDNNTSGLFINRLNQDTSKLAEIFDNLVNVMTEIVTNIGILIAIFIINKVFFLYFLISITVLFIINKTRMKNRFKVDKELRKINEKNTGLIGEMVRGLRDIKVLNAENNFIAKIKESIKKSNQTRYKMNSTDRKWQMLSGTVRDIIDFSFVVLGVCLILKNALSVEKFVIIYMYRNRLYNLLNYFSVMIEYIKDFNLSASRVFELFNGKYFKKESFGNIDLKEIHGDFEFKNVTFAYQEKNPIINNLSFKIHADETVAFVGKSGGGKSTIFSLLTKLYHPQSGNIYIDGIDINDLTKDSIRSNISIITQNSYIFNLTIKENLQIVKEDASEEEIKLACKNACLHDFIETLPDSYDTVVGEGGVTLSGGQRQRLAIARAFLKNSEIILFDEATSALDNETQENIQKAIINLQKTKTILIIAHRLSTVIGSDRIHIVDDGKIVGEGTHYDLLKTNELYRKLYTSELQK